MDFEFRGNAAICLKTHFILHFIAFVIEENQINGSDMLIYTANGNIYISASEHAPIHNNGVVQHAALTITDIMGRTLLQQEIPGQETIIPANYQTGVYIVTVRYGNEVKTEKIFVK